MHLSIIQLLILPLEESLYILKIIESKAGANCLKCMQLQLCAVVRQVYAVVIAVAVVAALSHHLQLYLQLCLA